MKKLIFVSLVIISLVSSGCGICNLDNFITPDDTEFLALIKELDTPEKICAYMKDNFKYEAHPFTALSPYELSLSKKGDCNDFSTFAVFITNYHGYETYQIHIYFTTGILWHGIAVYKENGKYNYSSNQEYYLIMVSTFKEVIEHCLKVYYEYELKSYIIYDYDMNIIEQTTK